MTPLRRLAVEAARDIALQKVVNGAKYPKRSSSPTDNLAHQCETSAWAELYEWANGYVKMEE